MKNDIKIREINNIMEVINMNNKRSIDNEEMPLKRQKMTDYKEFYDKYMKIFKGKILEGFSKFETITSLYDRYTIILWLLEYYTSIVNNNILPKNEFYEMIEYLVKCYSETTGMTEKEVINYNLVNYRANNTNALKLSIRNMDLWLVGYCVVVGAEVTSDDVFHCMHRGNVGIQYVIDETIQVEWNEDNIPLLDILCKAGYVNIRDERGDTILHKLYKSLILTCTETTYKDDVKKETLNKDKLNERAEEYIESIKCVLENGFDVNIRNNEGKNVLEIYESIPPINFVIKSYILDLKRVYNNKNINVIYIASKRVDHILELLERYNAPNKVPNTLKEIIKKMFNEINNELNNIVSDNGFNKINIISYEFLMKKILELLGHNNSKNYFVIKENENKYIRDYVWYTICKNLKWDYIETV